MSSGITFSGLGSGIDTTSIINQLMTIEQQPVTQLQNQQQTENTKLTALQDINTSLLAVKTSAAALADPNAFDVYTANSGNTAVVDATASTSAAPGNFSVEVLSLAQAQSRSSQSFTSNTNALGLSGDIVLNGKAVSIASTDSLSNIQDSINAANAGVQAQILKVSNTDYRLLLTSQTTGKDGFSLQDASTTNVLQSLGFSGASTSVKNPITGGAQSDTFASSTAAVGGLLGLSNPASGTVTIGNKSVSLDLATQSLSSIADAINAAAPTGVTASLVPESVNGTTQFRLQIDGTQNFTDSNNVLQALGVLTGSMGTTPAVAQVQTADAANTTDGSTPITANTSFNNLFGAGVKAGDTISISGTTHDGTAVSGSFTISNPASTRVQDLLDQISTVFGSGVTAGIDSSGHLTVTDNTAGASQLSVSVKANNEGGGSLSFGTLSTSTAGQDAQSSQVVAGQDASFRLNGVTLSRSSNTVSDALTGVTLNLKSAQPGTPVTVSVAQDTSSIQSAIQKFVSDYNSANDLINTQFTYDSTTQTSGPLAGDATLLSLQSQLRSLVANPVSGLADNQNNLTLFGVSFNQTGDLTVDSTKLADSMQNNPTGLKQIFTGTGSTSDPNVSFVFQGTDTKPGTYDVSVTTAPEQGATQGTQDLSGGLTADQSFTVLDSLTNRSQAIDLKAGDTTDTIVSKINSALSSSAAEVRTSTVANTTDGTTPINANTTFSSISGAGVAAGDTINIQGTLHSGEHVSGTFTITDPTTQTVGDLLTKVKSVFQGTVSASVDSNGQLQVSDNEVGNSGMTLALIEHNEGGGSLNFGSMDETAQGRYSIGVTASNQGGMLKLTADSYGAAAGFTVSQSNNGTGITDGTYKGVDVAGTLNGEAATGSGRTLTGNSDSTSVAGLVVQVNLTPAELAAQGSDQGTVKVTQGVADQLNRALTSITDPLSGMIATREKSINDTIQADQDQIDAMQLRLTNYKQMLQNQFTAMETSVAQLNSMGSFLSSQLSALSTQQTASTSSATSSGTSSGTSSSSSTSSTLG